ncbi:MAG: EAL domain-containing protein [Proteobacteria bacterium]|nr:EAL domain-containing protein [Pseudomonadota bacterium]
MDYIRDLKKRIARIGFGRKNQADLLTPEHRTVHEAVDALANGRVFIRTEEVIDTRSGAIYYHETLCKLQDAQGRDLKTFQTLMRLQSWGLHQEVGLILVDKACAEGLASGKRIGVNIGPQTIQSANSRYLLESLLDQWIGAGLSPRNIVLEIVESAPFEITPARKRWLDKLRAKGIAIGLDDFGAGYHTMHHLRALPLDFIKLDGHIIRQVLDGKAPDWLDEALAICARRNITVIGEHTDTPAEALSLHKLGIYHVQSRNLSHTDFTGTNTP